MNSILTFLIMIPVAAMISSWYMTISNISPASLIHLKTVSGWAGTITFALVHLIFTQRHPLREKADKKEKSQKIIILLSAAVTAALSLPSILVFIDNRIPPKSIGKIEGRIISTSENSADSADSPEHISNNGEAFLLIETRKYGKINFHATERLQSRGTDTILLNERNGHFGITRLISQQQ
ncbi:MAG: hypothetical protein CVV64_07785 [Candidatus Wallbacteria bacterium HGW-Wallbacteria-1]|jgi:hypothetical protein|uniref:Uncharacterized protein n=1 Tax=Candidatus Wallbacteria bacterium HGW-Wallbacteria-1 TaxID=2013854 RepID=A0A2N1PR06_9BACT|nr:MAG: hypothetical protein CVV64_07785 [Candidatus Wallbacteria bacterium HGW-Wallbacteria-1]